MTAATSFACRRLPTPVTRSILRTPSTIGSAMANRIPTTSVARESNHFRQPIFNAC